MDDDIDETEPNDWRKTHQLQTFLNGLLDISWLAPSRNVEPESVSEKLRAHISLLCLIGMGWGYEPPKVRFVSWREAKKVRLSTLYVMLMLHYRRAIHDQAAYYGVPASSLTEAYWSAYHLAESTILTTCQLSDERLIRAAAATAGHCAAGHAEELAIRDDLARRNWIPSYGVEPTRWAFPGVLEAWRLGLFPMGDWNDDFVVAVPGRAEVKRASADPRQQPPVNERKDRKN